jgi:NhaP-type Na+/H+ or K+/H+ antiporter
MDVLIGLLLALLVTVLVLLYLPVVFVLRSSDLPQNKKYKWALVVLCFSWFGYVAFRAAVQHRIKNQVRAAGSTLEP